MGRRWVIFATATLLILALSSAAAAGTAKNTPAKEAGATTRRPGSGNPTAGSGKSCTPCAAELGKTRTSGKSGKATGTAKNSPCHPKKYLDPNIAVNYSAAVREMKREGIKPEITSTWRSTQDQAQLRRCSMSARCRRNNPGLYLALPPGTSLHEAGFAIDMSGIAAGPRGGKRLTSKGRRIVSIMRKNGFTWRYGLSDPAHFEADPRQHGYRNLKQAINRTQTTCQIDLAKAKARKKPENRTATNRAQSPSKATTPRETTATKSHSSPRRVGP